MSQQNIVELRLPVVVYCERCKTELTVFSRRNPDRYYGTVAPIDMPAIFVAPCDVCMEEAIAEAEKINRQAGKPDLSSNHGE